jgi:hypothetical protein
VSGVVEGKRERRIARCGMKEMGGILKGLNGGECLVGS